MAHPAELIVQHICNLADRSRRSTATDGQLLTRWVLERDSRAFAALVARHGPLIWRVSHGVLHRTEDTEDIFQATFLILARKATTLRKHSSIAGWLYQTAHRLALKARKASVRRLRRESQAAGQNVADPLEEISVREAHLILGEELDRLSPGYREPLLLCLYEGATQDEAARRLGCSVRTLQRRLERARNLLSRRLTRHGLAPASALALTLCSRSELPAALARKTIAAAMQFVSGKAMTGTAVVLAEGDLRTVMLKKAAAYVTLVVSLGGLTVAGFAMTREAAPGAGKEAPMRQARAAAQAFVNKEACPRVDVNGDPLPVGAVNRIGSNRFRHGGVVPSVLYTPDGKAIASTSSDYNLRLWDASTGKLRWQFEMEEKTYDPALAVSSDGKKLAMLMSFEYVEIACDTGKKLVQHKWPQEGNANFVRCKAIARDLTIFARGCFDGTVRIHDAASGKETKRVVVGDNKKTQFPSAIDFSPDGKTIYAIVKGKPAIVIIDTRTGREAQTLKRSKDRDYTGTEKLAISPMGQLLAIIDYEQAVVWDLKRGKEIYCLQKEEMNWLWGSFSINGRLFAVANAGGEIIMFDTIARKEKIRLRVNHMVARLAFSPDGKTLAAGDDGSITQWDIGTGKPLQNSPEPRGLRYVRFADNSKQALCVGDSVGWWDVTTGKLLRQLTPDPKWNNDYSRSVSPDGKLLAVSSFSGEVELMDAATGDHVRTLIGHKSTNRTSTIFSPDGAKLFTAGWFDPRVMIWDVATGKLLHELQSHTRFVDRLAVSPDGRWLASAAAANNARNDWDIRLWETATGKLIHRLAAPRNTFSMVFSPDSSHLISVGSGLLPIAKLGEVRLWDVATGSQVRAFVGHKASVSRVAIAPDGRMLATGSKDKTLRLWEIATGEERGRITGHEGYVFSLDFSPNGRLLAAASSDAPVYIWDAYATPYLKLTKGKLPKEARGKLWQALADTDAAVAFRAMCELIAHPSEASAILEGGWKQLPRATPKQMRAWVDDLSSAQFTVRKTATTELERFAAAHESLLRDGLKHAGSLEARQRLEKILGRINPEGLRRSRMLEVLEQLHTAPARRFLQTLAEQTEDTAMAREAAAGLGRRAR